MKSVSRSRYETLAPLGTGGMARVFVGRRRGGADSSELVALKRAHPQVSSSAVLIDALRREARLGSCINHPNVVRVRDIDDDAGALVLVLDYIEGATLDAIVRRLRESRQGPMEAAGPSEGRCPREIVRVLLDTATGLDAVHRAKGRNGKALLLVHRDVSPSNMLVGVDGIARLSDFGVAKVVARSLDPTATGVLKGKIAYMAPEYVERCQADVRSDLFSLGVVAWEALTGRRLFKGATDLETVRNLALLIPPRPSEISPELGPLDAVILKALERDPERRDSSVADFARNLQRHAAAAGLLGTHEDVAALVQRLFGAELAERRRLLEVGESTDAETSITAGPVEVEAEAERPTAETSRLNAPFAFTRYASTTPVMTPSAHGFVRTANDGTAPAKSTSFERRTKRQLGVLFALFAIVFAIREARTHLERPRRFPAGERSSPVEQAPSFETATMQVTTLEPLRGKSVVASDEPLRGKSVVASDEPLRGKSVVASDEPPIATPAATALPEPSARTAPRRVKSTVVPPTVTRIAEPSSPRGPGEPLRAPRVVPHKAPANPYEHGR